MKLNVFQSVPEALIYFLLALVLVFNVGCAIIIINNQHANAVAVKQYIACIITPGTLKSTDTVIQIKEAERICFDDAPQVK